MILSTHMTIVTTGDKLWNEFDEMFCWNGNEGKSIESNEWKYCASGKPSQQRKLMKLI